MADFDAVEVVVEIVNNASDELDEIDRKFEELKRKHSQIKSDLKIRDYGSIARTDKRLDHLARARIAPIYAKVIGGGNFSMGGGGGGSGGLPVPAPSSLPAAPSVPDIPGAGGRGVAGALPGSIDPITFGDRLRVTRREMGRFARGIKNRLQHAVTQAAESIDGLDGAIKGLIPSYHMIVSIIAAIMPMMVTLAVQGMGVATAFGAIAAAGAGMFGLGLLGQGDTLAESLSQSRQLLKEFKTELYETFRPAAKLFAPFTEGILRDGASEFQPLADAATNLTVFEDSVQSAFRGLIEWVSLGLEEMAKYEPMIEALADSFGGAVGSTIINFFRFVTEEAYENREMLMRLGATFVTILGIIYELSVAMSNLVVVLQPIFQLILWISSALNNEWVAAFAAAAVAIYAVQKALAALAAVKAFLATLAGGIGLVAVAAGVAAGTYALMTAPARDTASYNNSVTPGGVAAGAGGTTVNNTMVVQGDVSQKHIREWETMWDEQYQETTDFEDGMAGPA